MSHAARWIVACEGVTEEQSAKWLQKCVGRNSNFPCEIIQL